MTLRKFPNHQRDGRQTSSFEDSKQHEAQEVSLKDTKVQLWIVRQVVKDEIQDHSCLWNLWSLFRKERLTDLRNYCRVENDFVL